MKKLHPKAVPPKIGRKKKRVVKRKIQKPVDAPQLEESKVQDSLLPKNNAA